MGTISDIGLDEDFVEVEEAQAKTRREEVYELIDGERGYQLRRWGVMGEDGHLHDTQKSVGEYLVHIKHFLDKAISELTTCNSNDEALEQVRKLTALGVACMEQHQTRPRLERVVENLRSGPIT